LKLDITVNFVGNYIYTYTYIKVIPFVCILIAFSTFSACTVRIQVILG